MSLRCSVYDVDDGVGSKQDPPPAPRARLCDVRAGRAGDQQGDSLASRSPRATATAYLSLSLQQYNWVALLVRLSRSHNSTSSPSLPVESESFKAVGAKTNFGLLTFRRIAFVKYNM